MRAPSPTTACSLPGKISWPIDDKGRPIILISHSQGSVNMIKLLQSQVDDNPSLRHRIVVAIIAGGNVTVPDGKEVGVTFQHLPVCTKASQTSCVIAFSSFPTEPPANSMFGRPGQGISLNYGQTQTTGVHVVCVNPASIGGGTGELASSFPLAAVQPLPAQMLPDPAVNTPWVTYPDMYSASCESTGSATWLQITHNAPAGDVRPLPAEPLGPTFGYHLDDINLSNGQPRQRRTRRGGRLQGLSYRPRRAIQVPVKGPPHNAVLGATLRHEWGIPSPGTTAAHQVQFGEPRRFSALGGRRLRSGGTGPANRIARSFLGVWCASLGGRRRGQSTCGCVLHGRF